MFLLRNLSSLPTILNGSIVMLPVGGRFGRMSETAFCILETAAAHGDRCEGRVENMRLDGRMPRASSLVWHRGHMERGLVLFLDARIARESRSARVFMLTDCIDNQSNGGRIKATSYSVSSTFGKSEN